MSRYEDVDVKDTLASQLDCKIHMLDGMPTCCFLKVQCVDDVTQLRNYATAITPTCMLYKNYTARAINPRIYNKPYIGLGAIKIQLATIEQELENLKQEIKLQKANYEDLKNGQALLNQSQSRSYLLSLRFN